MASPSTLRRASRREALGSAAVLSVLAAVALWMGIAQGRFSDAARLAVTGGDGIAPSVPTQADLLAPWPEGLQRLATAESFSPATLSDKIDGKAELYLPAGFVALRCQRFAPAAKGDAWLEAFIYDMGKPDQAFSVYSSQKRAAHADAKIGEHSYRAANQLCFVHGQYYVEVIAAVDATESAAAADAFGRAFVAATGVQARATAAQDQALFPADGMIPGTVMLLSADVFGFDRLTNVFVARYRDGSDTVTLYLSRRPNPADAGAIATALRRFFVDECGGATVATSGLPAGAALIDVGGSFETVFAAGPFLAGVHEAPNREAAERWTARVHAAVTSTQP